MKRSVAALSHTITGRNPSYTLLLGNASLMGETRRLSGDTFNLIV